MMAQTIDKNYVLKRPLGQDLELQAALKSDPLCRGPKMQGCIDQLIAVVELEQRIQPGELTNEAPSLQNNRSSAYQPTHNVDTFFFQGVQQKRLRHHAAPSSIQKGNLLLQLQGTKDNWLKCLMKATLFKTFGLLMGRVHCEGKHKNKVIRISGHGTIKFKRNGIPSKHILQKMSEVHLMERTCDVDDGRIFLPGMVEDVHHDVLKYWLRRYSLFSRFDEGMKLDEEGLFSVTPEDIAKQQAAHCGSGTIIDAFTGVGGNAIQFACMDFNVIAIDIDPKRVEYAQHNAEVYGVAHKIDFLAGDFFQLAPTLKADVVFLSPPWGGPEYIKAEKYDIETMLKPVSGFCLFELALSIAPSVAFFLPRTVDVDQLARLSWLSDPPLPYKLEQNHVQGELKAVTAYYGQIVRSKDDQRPEARAPSLIDNNIQQLTMRTPKYDELQEQGNVNAATIL